MDDNIVQVAIDCPICSSETSTTTGPAGTTTITNTIVKHTYLIPKDPKASTKVVTFAPTTKMVAIARFYPEAERKPVMHNERAVHATEPQILLFTCPIKQVQFQATFHSGDNSISNPEAASPRNIALYNTGTKLLDASLTMSSSFCTTMNPISTGAIALYTGLFALILPQSYLLGWPGDLIELIPPILFLAASVGFAYGAYPRVSSLALDNPQSIEDVRENIIQHRALSAFISFSLFSLAMLAAVLVILLIAITHQHIQPGVPSTPK